MQKKYKIENCLIEEVLYKLNRVTIEKQPFTKPKGIYFLGKINNKSFRLITFNSPPVKLDFQIKENNIEIDYKKDSLSKTLGSLTYILLYPPFVFFLLLSLISDRYGNIETIILSVTLILPLLTKKVVIYFYEKYFLANDLEIKLLLEDALDVKIEEIDVCPI